MVDGSGGDARVPTTVVQYDPTWPTVFELIASELRAALGDTTYVIEHVGSTAVPGLAAKPIIDLDVVVDSADQVPAAVAALGRGGWEHLGDGGLDGREMFAARDDLPHHHLYVVVRGNHQHLLHTRFRDILRADGQARVEYAELKLALAPLLLTDRVAYTQGKSSLIADLMQRRS